MPPSLLLALALLLPSVSIAQYRLWEGGLFGRGIVPDEMLEEEEVFFREHGYRGGLFYPTSMGGYNLYNQLFGSDVIGGYELYNQTFGQDNEEAPLGSGLLVLTAAGAFYALRKRKYNENNHKS